MNYKYRTEVLINDVEQPSLSIKVLLPYKKGDIFYYSESDCPAYYDNCRKNNEKIPINMIDDYIPVLQDSIKSHHIHLFKVKSVNNSTRLELLPNGEVLTTTLSLNVIEHFTILEKLKKLFTKYILLK